ncbi:MAG: hypothetical protein R6U93_06965 [Dehalococcoidia bacterium]
MERTWKPTVAGILTILAGVFQVIVGIAIVLMGLIGSAFIEIEAIEAIEWLGLIGLPLAILGIVSIVGGVFALKRRMWGLALTGAICAMMAGNPINGTLAIIFVSLGKGEFE